MGDSYKLLAVVATGCALSLGAQVTSAASPAAVTIDSNQVIRLNGTPVFTIGFNKAPPPESKTPGGEDAYVTLRNAGAVFHLAGVPPHKWGPEAEAELDHILDRSAQAGLLVAIYIPDLTAIDPSDQPKKAELARVVRKYRDHPALGFWKAEDEPEWGKVPVPWVQTYYDIIHELDPNHPVWLTQAPRGTVESLRTYNHAYDVGALDIYPVGYPPGVHSLLANKNISMVGDYAKEMEQVTEEKKPFWMTLQICWSGVARQGRTLRFPTFPEERYMSYQAIIDGARGLNYFGGTLPACLNGGDRALGWNWTFYRRVLQPVLEELKASAPVYPALVAPDSKLPVKLEGANDVEFRVREAAGQIFLLAAKREGATVQVKFSGLPQNLSTGDVLYEEPRRVAVSAGSFTDWFGPNEVHVYRFGHP